jgi:uncharacterized membrane protein
VLAQLQEHAVALRVRHADVLELAHRRKLRMPPPGYEVRVPRFEQEVRIGRPPADVFTYLTDLANLPEWQGSVVEVRRDDDGPLRTGARFTEVRRLAGRRLESTVEVVTLDPDRELTLRAIAGPAPGTVRHVLEPDSEGTRLRIVGELAGGGLRGLAGPLLERAARREVENDLRRLKRLLEAG